ncbi:PREDICTED: RNA exonuclease 4 [Crocodylus porosus]|nr:PREDICTED: RNA exonuclease 4 [Crocodylus porosus]
MVGRVGAGVGVMPPPRQGRRRWFRPAARDAARAPRAALALPPTAARDFSANWRALQEVLKRKAAGLAKSLPASETSSKPQRATKDVEVIPAVYGSGNTVKFKAVNQMEGDAGQAGASPTNAKSERTAPGKSLGDARSNRKEFKAKRENGNSEKQGDIKHKRRKAEEHAAEQPPTEDDIWFDGVDPEDIEAAIGPEAAKVARRKMGLESTSKPTVEQVLVKEKAFSGLTKAVAMDCEMVGVGPQGEDSIVARVSIVNRFGKCIYDKYVRPTEKVTDYRTEVSGIRPEDTKKGEDFKKVQEEVADILRGRILVGHAVHNDLKILFLDHPKKNIRDTQRYKPFKQKVKSGRPSLKLLCEKLLNVKVQTSEHCSIQDAQAAMRLYTLEKKQWEAAIKEKIKLKKK